MRMHLVRRRFRQTLFIALMLCGASPVIGGSIEVTVDGKDGPWQFAAEA